MANLLLNDPEVLEDFISLGKESQVHDHLQAKQFYPCLDCNLRGLKLRLELHEVLFVKADTLLSCSLRQEGVSAYTQCLQILA